NPWAVQNDSMSHAPPGFTMKRFTMKKPSFAGALIFFVFLSPAVAQRVDFGRDIRPILSDRCFLCHGPDEANRKVNLRLDTEAGARQVRGNKTPVVPGNPDGSELFRRISAVDSAVRMPPAYSGYK